MTSTAFSGWSFHMARPVTEVRVSVESSSAIGVPSVFGVGATPRLPWFAGVAVGASLIASSVASTEAFMESSPTVSTPGSLRFAGLGVQPAIMAVAVSNTIVPGVITLIKDFAISIRVKLLISMIVSFQVV